MDPTQSISFMEQLTLRQDLAESPFKFFDRIEGYIYPGYEINRRKVSTKIDTIESITVGYDNASTNPFKNLGEFVQSSGKMGLETFKLIRSPNINRITMSFEFMNQDKATYTINEAMIFFAYAMTMRTISFTSPNLKLLDGISGQTRLTLSKYNMRYVHDRMDEQPNLLNTIITDFSELSNSEYDAIPMVFEVYIK